ncbi:EAL and HDOD domain-containing protein [Marinomonas algicola]|uniref:EAL and HDOD domain-containing protein n=1 Tax=Marinomonas algicola TaxID=2773454 RepID=UPI00174C0256|nr:HDOD domain-containing protein [Marinomonas algicola]
MKPETALFARQAILDSQYKIYAYQLLLAHKSLQPKNDISEILSSLFLDLPLNKVNENKPLLIDIDLSDIQSVPLLPVKNIVICFTASNRELEESAPFLQSIIENGYQLALINPDFDDLTEKELAFFSYVKISVERYGVSNVISYANAQKFVKLHIIITDLSIKQQLDKISDLTSIKLFSGDLLNIREDVKGNKVPIYKSLISKVIILINSPLVNLKDIAAAIEIDSTLSYKIIKLTKSAMYYRNFRITNVQRALEVIGLRDLIKWFGMALLTSIDGKPDCLYRMAISRAYFTQAIAETLCPKQEGAFITGLFSYLPVFFNENIEVLLNDLPLDDEINNALIHHQGELGEVLRIVCLYELGRWNEIPFANFERFNLDKEALKKMYITSLIKTRELDF